MDEQMIRSLIKEELVRNPTKMTEDEKIKNACEFRDIIFHGVQYAESRTESVADEYTKLEVTVAALMLGFSSFFLSYFDPNTNNITLPSSAVILMKVAFSINILLLFASLACGLMYLKSAEKWWNNVLNQRFIRFKMWNKVPKKEVSFEEAKAFHEGTTLELGNITSAPNWTWVLQTVFLGLACAIFVILILVYLFALPVAIISPTDTIGN